MLNLFFFLCNKEIRIFLRKNKRTTWSTYFRWLFTTKRLRTLRILSLENPDIGWTFWFPSVIVTSIIKIKQTLHQNNSKHQFATVHFICWMNAFMALILTTFYRLYLHWCILNAHGLYFVLSLYTHDSDWTVTTETQMNRDKEYFSSHFFSYFSVVFLHCNHEICEPNKHSHQCNWK